MRLIHSMLLLLAGCPGDAVDPDLSEPSPVQADTGGLSADDCDDADASVWYADDDEDGYGDPDEAIRACEQPDGTVTNSEDCDDDDQSRYPSAPEVCDDGLVQDCSGTSEDASKACRLVGDLNLSLATAKMVGEADEDAAGSSVSGAGDVDGDGIGDLILGAPYKDVGSTYAGAAYLVSGPFNGDMDLSLATAKFLGEEARDDAGDSVSGAGDVDGDGFSDLLIGAWGQDAGGRDAGAAYLVSGPVRGEVDLSSATAKFIGEDANDWTGYPVSSAGDVDGDGLSDLLIGSYAQTAGGIDAGAAYLVSGPVIGDVDLSSATAKFIGEEAGDCAGYDVSDAGDVDGDGLSDVLIGARDQDEGASKAGAAYLVSGAVSGDVDLSLATAKLIGEEANDWAAYVVSGAGDVDGDGLSDLLIGASGQDAGGDSAGSAYLVSGPVRGALSLSMATAKLIGEAEDDLAGSAVSNAGDVDADGFGDLLIGAYHHDAGGIDAGAAYLVSGPVSGGVDLSMASAKLIGENEEDWAGHAVSGAGDVDGNGLADVLIGAPYHDGKGADTGAAYLVSSFHSY